jgi:3-hexulose-6-phosphate synthase
MIAGSSPMDELDDVVRAVSIPVQAVGGLSLRQAIECPAHGAPLVVLGAPLVIDADEFKTASNDLHDVLTEICREIRRVPFQRPAHWAPPHFAAE